MKANKNDWDEESIQIMRRKLYGNNIQATCEYCEHGRQSSDGKAVLCPKKGVMPLYHHCRKFLYDPLKRTPSKLPELRRYAPEEFSISPEDEKTETDSGQSR